MVGEVRSVWAKGGPHDRFAQRMLEELQRRIFSETKIKAYVRVVENFARYF